MLSLETVSCLGPSRQSRQFLDVLVLVLVLELLSRSNEQSWVWQPGSVIERYDYPTFMLTKNILQFVYWSPDSFAYLQRQPLYSAFFFSGGIIMRPHRAKMSDDLLEMLMHLRCNGN